MTETNKDICCYCEEETKYDQGYEIWEAFDGQYGHEWCVKKYDDKNKPYRMVLEEDLQANLNKLNNLERERNSLKSIIDQIQDALYSYEDEK